MISEINWSQILAMIGVLAAAYTAITYWIIGPIIDQKLHGRVITTVRFEEHAQMDARTLDKIEQQLRHVNERIDQILMRLDK